MKKKFKRFKKLFKDNKILILTLLIVALVGVSVGYAALSTYLEIQGYAVVDISSWSVIFDNLDEAVLTGRAYEETAPVITDNKTQIGTYNVVFSEPGDSVSYSFDVVNEGGLNAYLSLINVSEPVCSGAGDNAISDAEYVCSHLNYSLTYEDGHELDIDDTLNAGTTKRLKLTLSYDDPTSTGALPKDDVNISNLDVTLVYSEADVGQKETYKFTVIPDPIDSHVVIRVADMIIKEGDGKQTINLTTGLTANYTVSKNNYDTFDGTYTMGQGNRTINVKLDETPKYTVSFNPNGGSGGQSSSVLVKYGEEMPGISATKPTRSGYTFMGWYDGTNYTSAKQYYNASGTSVQTYDLQKDLTLYAGWEVETYTITFYANGGTLNGASTMEATYNTTYGTFPTPTAPANTNAVFIGWFDKDYKDTPLKYYADHYNLTYDETQLYNHYINNQGNRTSQYAQGDTVEITSDTPLYAGYIYTWNKYSTNITWNSTLINSGVTQNAVVVNQTSWANNSTELEGLIEPGSNYTINWTRLPSSQQHKAGNDKIVAGKYYPANDNSLRQEGVGATSNLDYSDNYAIVRSISGTIIKKITSDIYRVSNVQASKGSTYYGLVYSCNSTKYPSNGYYDRNWYVKV